MKQILTILLSFVLLSSQAQYAGMTAVNFGNTKGLVRLPANYATQPNKRFPLILHFCGNGEVGTDLTLLLNTGFGRQVSMGRISGTVADSIINIIVQSPSSGAIRLPSAINPVIDYILKNYRVDTTKNVAGKYNFVLLAGLSQGAADIWDIASWDPANTDYGVSKYSGKIKHVWPASIPVLFPSTATFQRLSGSIFHFTHENNITNSCCVLWPAQDLNKNLIANGSNSTIAVILNGGHDNTTWDAHWSPLGKDTTTNMYLQVLSGWSGIGAPPPSTIEYLQPVKFYYADPNAFVKIEINGTAVYNDPAYTQLKEYRYADGTVCKTFIARL